MKWTQFVSQYKKLLICSLAIAISGSSIVSLSIPKTYCSIKQISINASEDKLGKATAKLKILFNNPTIEPSKVTTEPEIINELLKSPKLFLLMGEEYVKTSKNKKLKLKDYLSLSREPWWCRLFNSQEEQSKIRRCLMTEVDLKTGIISIAASSVSLPGSGICSEDPCRILYRSPQELHHNRKTDKDSFQSEHKHSF